MSGLDKCFDLNKTDETKKGEKKEKAFQGLKTTTETSTFFFLSKFNPKDVSCQERNPKNFKDLDYLLNKILMSLEETENVFMNQAREVLHRDLTLINWRLRLKNLHNLLKAKQQDFERIDQTVECFMKLSTHIDCILGKIEKNLPGSSLICSAFKYTPARMSMYDMMMKISISQRDMLQQLAAAFISINEVTDYNPLDPVEQFTRLLSLHLEVLKTIERRTGVIDEELRVIKALYKFYGNKKTEIMYDYYC